SMHHRRLPPPVSQVLQLPSRAKQAPRPRVWWRRSWVILHPSMRESRSRLASCPPRSCGSSLRVGEEHRAWHCHRRDRCWPLPCPDRRIRRSSVSTPWPPGAFMPPAPKCTKPWSTTFAGTASKSAA
ncbi:unnamed protein product, partial [Symbiodinium sp. CCMP2592]